MQRKNYSNPYTLNIKGKGNKYTNFPENVSERANNRDIYKKVQKTGQDSVPTLNKLQTSDGSAKKKVMLQVVSRLMTGHEGVNVSSKMVATGFNLHKMRLIMINGSQYNEGQQVFEQELKTMKLTEVSMIFTAARFKAQDDFQCQRSTTRLKSKGYILFWSNHNTHHTVRTVSCYVSLWG